MSNRSVNSKLPALTVVLAMLLSGIPLSQPAAATSIETAGAHIKTAGNLCAGCWGLWSISEWGDFFEFKTAGRYRVTIEAGGTPAENQWPAMAVFVDHEPVFETRVNTLDLKTYEFTTEMAAGPHRVTVGFLNERIAWDGIRSLAIKRLTVEPLDGDASAPLLTSEARWRPACLQNLAAREHQLLTQAEAAIERNRKTATCLVVKDADGRVVTGATIRVNQTTQDFLFGNNFFLSDRCSGSSPDNDEQIRRFLDLFNYTTVGFYWCGYENQRGQPNYPSTDHTVAWCLAHGIRMKGHPVLWSDEGGIPPWSHGLLPAPDVQQQRVLDLVGRYRGRIANWEIVNEPAHLAEPTIARPYQWARQTDPQAQLIVNDYQVMADGFLPFYQLLQDAIDNHVPFDGIGLQAHEPRFARFSMPAVQHTLDRYATLGKPLHITEFVATSGGQPLTASPMDATWDETRQADYAVKFYTVCFAHPAVVAITWWDLSDRDSWLSGAGLLRADLTPKPVYYALRTLIREKWLTRATGTTDAHGEFAFRGFHGTYSAQVDFNGRHAQTDFHLTKTAPARVEVTLK